MKFRDLQRISASRLSKLLEANEKIEITLEGEIFCLVTRTTVKANQPQEVVEKDLNPKVPLKFRDLVKPSRSTSTTVNLNPPLLDADGHPIPW